MESHPSCSFPREHGEIEKAGGSFLGGLLRSVGANYSTGPLGAQNEMRAESVARRSTPAKEKVADLTSGTGSSILKNIGDYRPNYGGACQDGKRV